MRKFILGLLRHKDELQICPTFYFPPRSKDLSINEFGVSSYNKNEVKVGIIAPLLLLK